MRAWLFQDTRRKRELGDKAPWSVGWYDPDGRKKSKSLGAKSLAEKYARKIEGQLAAGKYQATSRKDWKAFRAEYNESILLRFAPSTKVSVEVTLKHFERITKPGKVSLIKTATVDEFIAGREKDKGPKKGSTISPATINHDLRHLKSVLRVAHEWGYLSAVPKFRKVKEPDQMGKVITQEHFAAIFNAADSASMPGELHCPPGDWWRALLMFAMTTGWRIDEILSLKRRDIDLETGAIVTRAADNKASRDEMDYLPGPALDLLKRIASFAPTVFPWPHHRRTLQLEFHAIQAAAGINLACRDAERHECSDACHKYGFHALRRGYATMNVDRLPAAVLQKKMRHKSFETTLGYIKLAEKMQQTAENVYVPEFALPRLG